MEGKYSVESDPSCAPRLCLDPLCFGAKHPDLAFYASNPCFRVLLGASPFGYSPANPLPTGSLR
eukprot:6191447-Pleurochrysis_carterae.AAC.1